MRALKPPEQMGMLMSAHSASLTRDVMGRKRHKIELDVVEGLELSDGWENTALSGLVRF